MQDIAIKTMELTKKFGELAAVDHVSFDVKSGEIFGLLGPNGAGKTTLIRMLCTLSRPTKGTAKVAGYDIKKEDSSVREHIGLVSEKLMMYDRLTAEENLRLFGKLYDIPSDTLKERINELLSLVRMEKWADHQIGTFSTGMKQRINVIRALLNQPEILFLDEPTLGLDPQSTGEIREFIKNINMEHKTTIILTTHMMVEADMLCDRVGIIDYGKIVAMDSPGNLKRMISGTDTTVVELHIPNLSTDITSQIESLGCINNVMVENDTHIKVQAKGDDAFDNIIDCVRNSGGKISSVKNLEPTLEDVFLHITGHEVREHTSDKVKAVDPGHGPRHGGKHKRRIR
ncbi:MAG: ATP-binding cassette domain-containing protein [Thermoplasmata archaeon]|nr:MAG: ATP-binding cassette domain-containing protein [Thermoplasmata archaeon]